MSTRQHKRKCAFPKCKIRANSGMFKFPKDEERRKKWLENCQMTADQINDRTTICQFHFRPQDLQIPANFQNKLLLKPGVVPIPYDPLEVNDTNSEDLALVDINEIVTNSPESIAENKDDPKVKNEILKDLTKDSVNKSAYTEFEPKNEAKKRKVDGPPMLILCTSKDHQNSGRFRIYKSNSKEDSNKTDDKQNETKVSEDKPIAADCQVCHILNDELLHWKEAYRVLEKQYHELKANVEQTNEKSRETE